MFQFLEGMCFLEWKNIALFYLKPSNILISNISDISTLKLKIIDFGFMKDISERKSFLISMINVGT